VKFCWSMRRDESVFLSLRLLTDTSMELASRCHLCRSRASYSAGPLPPRHILAQHRTSGPLFKNLYRVKRREESIFSSLHLLIDTSMELASRCHLCRSRAFGSKGPVYPQPDSHTPCLQSPHKTSSAGQCGKTGVSSYHCACSRMPPWSSPQDVTSIAHGLQAPSAHLYSPPPTVPPNTPHLRDSPMRTSTCRCGDTSASLP
jgi:hypothetical protein